MFKLTNVHICMNSRLTWWVSWLFLRSKSSRPVLLARPEQNAAKHSWNKRFFQFNNRFLFQWNYFLISWGNLAWKILVLLWILYMCMCDIHCVPLLTGSKNYIDIHSFTSPGTNTYKYWNGKTNTIGSVTNESWSWSWFDFACKEVFHPSPCPAQSIVKKFVWVCMQSTSFHPSPGRAQCNSIVKKDGWLFGCVAAGGPRMTSEKLQNSQLTDDICNFL